MQESRMQYLRNLLYQYLTCTDQSVSEQMERALITIFRFTPEERQQIDVSGFCARAKAGPPWLSSR